MGLNRLCGMAKPLGMGVPHTRGDVPLRNTHVPITIEDNEDRQIKVAETCEPGEGESDETITSAAALADAMFEVMDELGEVESSG